MPKVILASQSPRRKNLLQQIGFRFEVIPSHIEEHTTAVKPGDIVQDLALLKATDVAASHPHSFVIGADTIVVHKNEVLGKPSSNQEARQFLQRLSHSTHFVYTGMAFVKTDKEGNIELQHTLYEQTKVTFSSLDAEDIEAYIQTGSPLDKAGAYGIQDDMGALFVEKIEGDYYNIVGLPLNRFYRELKNLSPDLATFNQLS